MSLRWRASQASHNINSSLSDEISTLSIELGPVRRLGIPTLPGSAPSVIALNNAGQLTFKGKRARLFYLNLSEEERVTYRKIAHQRRRNISRGSTPSLSSSSSSL